MFYPNSTNNHISYSHISGAEIVPTTHNCGVNSPVHSFPIQVRWLNPKTM